MNKLILSSLIVIASVKSYSKDVIYNCFQHTGTIQAWEPHKTKGFELTKLDEARDFEITFVIKKRDATLKGNKDTVPLIKLNDLIFMENTGFNVILWKVYPSPKQVGKMDRVPTFIISQKSYELPAIGPSVVNTIYKCK